MNDERLAAIRERMPWAASREGPPDGFPVIPGFPVECPRAPDFRELEREHLFSRWWRVAAHEDEFPRRGSAHLEERQTPLG